MNGAESSLRDLRTRIARAAGARHVELIAVSKLQPASSIRELAALGQRSFGENYVQEALAKQAELDDLELEWHLIGPLQSNKCRDAASRFDWVQTVDRLKLIPLLAKDRPDHRTALNVLIQVNISDETSKSGCHPDLIDTLAQQIATESRLCLRGLMCIPAPWPDLARRTQDFSRMFQLFGQLRQKYAGVDTLSMGMSDDFELAIAEGATMVRIGSALFGERKRP